MANIYVNHTGSDTAPYDTEAKASTDIQVALDAVSAGDTVWIKDDSGGDCTKTYIMDGADQQAATFDIDANDRVTIKGYKTTIGDCDKGGDFYKTNFAVIDGNSGAFDVLVPNGVHGISIQNVKIIDVPVTNYPFLVATAGNSTLLRNVWFNGGLDAIDINGIYGLIIDDCRLDGVYTYDERGKAGIIRIGLNAFVYGALISNCVFDVINADRYIEGGANQIGNLVVRGNQFINSGTVTTGILTVGPLVARHNSFFTSGTLTTGIDVTNANSRIASIVESNILYGATSVFNGEPAEHDYNCYGSNSEDNGVSSDPLFMDAANDDLRLKPTSPCLNTGKPVLGNGQTNAGFTNIGAWQRKSLLGVR